MKIFNGILVSVLTVAFGLVGQVALAASPEGVNLGASGNFVILAKTGVSTTGSTSVVGDIGLSPAAASYVTGFALSLPAASAFSTSSLVTGKIYASDYAVPTPANLNTAVLNMQTAYTDAGGRAPDFTELGAGNIGGLTLVPGVYKWSTGVTIPTDVTLTGGGSDVWIFQIAQNLTTSSATHVTLAGGAQASNIYWQVAGQTTLGTTSVFNGNILDQTSIVLNTGATLYGRALAQSAVTLDSNSVTVPTAVVVNQDTGTSNTNSSNTNSTNSSGSNTGTGLNVSVSSTNTIPAVPATEVEGCVSGNLFSATSGKSCTVSATPAMPANAVSYNFGTVTLRSGSRGEAVMELQRFLNVKLNLGLIVDGKLGPKTIAVIKEWQRDRGLVADGLVGVKTKAAMRLEAGNN